MTQSRLFSSESHSILPCRLCYSQVLTVPTWCCSHERKNIWIFPSSIFFRMKPRAKKNFAELFSVSRTRYVFSSITWAVRLLTTKLNTLCLPFCNSESTKKCLHDCKSSCKLFSSSASGRLSISTFCIWSSFCCVITLFVVSQGTKTWKLSAAIFTRVIVLGSRCTLFFEKMII